MKKKRTIPLANSAPFQRAVGAVLGVVGCALWLAILISVGDRLARWLWLGG